MTQTLLTQKEELHNEAGQETISLEDIQRKIIQDQSLRLWLYYGENCIPLERDGKTHIITMQNKSHKATTRSGQTLDLTEQEMDYLRQYAYQHMLEEYSEGKTIVQPTGQTEVTQELEEEITQRDCTIQKQAQTIERLQACQDKIHEVAANKDMTYSDRVLWTIVLLNHTDEILSLKAFQPNISRLRQESGVGTDTATKFFASMHEAQGIKYSNKATNEEGDWSSVSTIVPLAEHAHVNTKAATKRIKQREEVTKRRLARKLITVPCENCGSDNPAEAYAAITPICRNCNHVTIAQQETVLAKNVRIIEEQIVEPTGETSHEFSEVTDHEFVETDEEAATTANNQEEIQADTSSHEFSDLPTEAGQPDTEIQAPTHEFSEVVNNLEEIQTDGNTHEASHEFSEGMRVNTPNGIGAISFIGEFKGRTRCRVRFSTPQQDGTYYAAFDIGELEPIVQASLLGEE